MGGVARLGFLDDVHIPRSLLNEDTTFDDFDDDTPTWVWHYGGEGGEVTEQFYEEGEEIRFLGTCSTVRILLFAFLNYLFALN